MAKTFKEICVGDTIYEDRFNGSHELTVLFIRRYHRDGYPTDVYDNEYVCLEKDNTTSNVIVPAENLNDICYKRAFTEPCPDLKIRTKAFNFFLKNQSCRMALRREVVIKQSLFDDWNFTEIWLS